jgi:aldose sugar dehydrogenase
MMWMRLVVGPMCLALGVTGIVAQTARIIPRPPAQAPGPAKPEDGTAAPDGYAPIPEWIGQTRAPRPAKVAAYTVETVAEGLTGAMSFSFLPDRRIIVGERPGRIRIVGKGGSVSEPIAGLPPKLWAHGQGLFDVRPDRAFANNRTIYLTYTVLPDGADPAALPRSPGVLLWRARNCRRTTSASMPSRCCSMPKAPADG